MKISTKWGLIDQVASPVLVIDRDAVINHANPASADLFKVSSSSELKDLELASLLVEDQERIIPDLLKCIQEVPVNQAATILDFDDNPQSVMISAVLISEQDGSPGNVVLTLQPSSRGSIPPGDNPERIRSDDFAWLAEQGRILLSLNSFDEIMDTAGQALADKLDPSIILCLTLYDEKTMRLDGIYGMENPLLDQILKLVGYELHGGLFPVDERFRDTYTKRKLYKHPGSLADFSRSQNSDRVSKQLEKLVGIKDIYLIGLEGNQGVIGCYYILTRESDLDMHQELVEAYAQQVALALEKTRFSSELVQSENKFKTIFEYAPDGYYLSDTQGNFLEGNLAAERITGFARSELISKSFLNIGLLSPGQLPKAGKLLSKNLLGKSTGPDEFTLNRKDGSTIPVEISTYPVKIEGKSVILGITRDISGRKISDLEIKNAHESLARVLEGIDAQVYVADIETHEILYMNKRMIEDYGGNFVGKLCHEILNNCSNPCHECSNSNLIDNLGEPGEVYVWEGQNKKNQRWYRNYDRAIRWTNQRLVRLQISVDITDSKMAANSIQQSEERYRSLFVSSNSAIMTVSPPDWRFTSGNPAMLKLFGLEDESQFLNIQPWQVSPEYQPDGQRSDAKAREMINIACEKGSNYFKWVHKKVSGEEFLATVLLTKVDLDDNFIIQATVTDISDRVQAEEKLEQQMQDLTLLNDLNVSANEGKDLNEILAQVSREMESLFLSRSTTVYLLNDDENYIQVYLKNLSNSLLTHVEKLTGISMPEHLEIEIRGDSYFRKILDLGEVRILSKKEEIFDYVNEYLASTFLSAKVEKRLRKLIPTIYPVMGIKSIIVAPLISAGKAFGFIDMSSSRLFSDVEMNRFKTYAEQLSGFIQKLNAENERVDKLNELELIYHTFVESSRLNDVDEICEHIADKIWDVNPDCYVMVTLYDPNVEAIRVRALKGVEDKLDGLIKLAGKNPNDFVVTEDRIEIDDDTDDIFTSKTLKLIPGGMYELARGTIPRVVCKSVERFMGVEEIHISGFGLGNKQTGGVVLFVKEGKKINYPAAIETITKHVATLFERRQIQSEIEIRQTQLEALRDVELEIASELDIEALLQSISEKARSIVDATACGFSIYNPDRNVLEYTAYSGFQKLPENTDVSPGEGLSGIAWENKETLIVENYKEWEGRLENWTDVSDYYLAGIPVSWGDEMLGVLEVALDSGETLSTSEISTLELFATQAAIAIKNARLFRDEKLRRTEADTLREVGVLINQMVGQPDLLDMILFSLQKVISYSSASIQLVSGPEIVIEAYLGEKPAESIIGTRYPISENNAAKEILLEGKNIILDNEEDIRNYLVGPNIGKIKSWLAVPLESKGQRIGILTLDHSLPKQYTSGDADLVKVFAAQAVVALENNRLFDEIRRRTIEIEAVYDSALALTKELQPEVLFDDLYQQIDPLFSPDAYILALYDQNSDMINVAYATELGIRQPQAEKKSISPEQKNSLLGWIIRNKSPLLIGNVETDSIPIQPLQQGRIVRSLLGVPILVGERVIGALVVQSYMPNIYTKNDQRLIQLLGNQVAIALENSRLFGDAQRRLARLSSLREIDQAISGGTDLGLTMDVLVNQLIHTLNVDAACVLAYVPSEQRLEYVDAKGFRTKSLQHTSLKLGSGLAGKAALEQHLVFVQDLNRQSVSLEQSPTFGQEGFVTYLAQPLITKGGLVGVLEIFNRSPLAPDPEWFAFLDSISRLAAIAIDRLNLYDSLAKSNIELKQAYDATIEGWAKAIELRDGDTEGHSRRVVALTMNLARKMKVQEEELVHMRRGALLHDIGKMAIPDGILLKAGKLSDEEWAIMKKHPNYAYDMLSNIDYLSQALDIPINHHERWDGSGYPRGLKEENIPLQARIFAVVDVWDALQSDRPYREAWTEEKSIQYLMDQSGKEFDPQVVKEFLELIGKI